MVGVVLLCVGACGQDESVRAGSEHSVRTGASERESNAPVLTECSHPGPGIGNASVRPSKCLGRARTYGRSDSERLTSRVWCRRVTALLSAGPHPTPGATRESVARESRHRRVGAGQDYDPHWYPECRHPAG